ncbi:T9SS type A sorting domain-containing protein [Algibacter sp. L4_22]|uniref:T9SS type A sorting domain-containing protein n=1 Tax=Algibacter sp. L4_22 TaxID=2942477 RepID=UPI00201B46C4|nr:T9SS type A sorting domain-containing protein [Algibacter sp. L4_22]MCL5128772.1 T9SS type A sorting domain-containing protein [Algibacter sp. L4_22]
MKLKLLLLFLITSWGYSQSSIAKFESAAGSEYAVVTSSPEINQGSVGTNTTWTFNLAYNNYSTSDELTIATTQEVANYPGATNVLTTSNSTESVGQLFLKKSGNIVEFVGAESNGLKLIYTDPGVLGNFPLSFSDSHTDAISGNYVFDNDGTTYNGFFSGNLSTEVDGYGILNVDINGLASGNFSKSVTRLKVFQSVILSYSIFTNAVSVDQISYYYYAANGDLVFRTSTIDITGSLITDSSSTFIESLTTSSLGIDDQKLNQVDFTILPNPVNNELNIGVQADIESISIVDLSGRQVLKVKTNEKVLAVNQLKSGLYIVNIITNKGAFSRKFVKK